MKTPQLLGAFCACVFSVFATTSHSASIPSQGTWVTTLQPRDLDSNPNTIEAYYDTDLNITWLANANLAESNSFGMPYNTDLGPYSGDSSGVQGYIYSNGQMNWPGAMLWIATMNTDNYLGYNGWRLPNTNPINGVSYDYTISFNGTTDYGYNISAAGTAYAGGTGSEMAHLFYDTLGNLGYCKPLSAGSCTGPQGGWGLSNTGPFSNFQPAPYVSATEYGLDITNYAWGFNFGGTYQQNAAKNGPIYGWAVHSGDIGVAIVPLPAAVWLFGSGLLGLIGIVRRRKAA